MELSTSLFYLYEKWVYVMNKYDERYEIRLGTKSDIDNIMEFIDLYWKNGHILSIDRKLFEYEFLDGNQVNMLLAIDKKTKKIEGIFGFIYCSKSSDPSKRDIWGSLWKVVEEHDNMPFLGIELAKRAYDITGCRMHIGNGANPNTTIPLRKMFFRDKTGKMKQYYFLNSNIKEYKIAKISVQKENSYIPKENLTGIIELNSFIEVKEFLDIEVLDVYPYKDNWYIERRYFKHPYYKYKFWGLRTKEKNEAIVIAREVDALGKKILRIIDYIGNHEVFSETGSFWNDIIMENEYEYIDFFEYGIRDDILENAGFVLREEDDTNVIPNYFEPFVQSNVDIWFHYKFEGTTFFKGDCDQDRPNIIK